jgi:hypothetical protein
MTMDVTPHRYQFLLHGLGAAQQRVGAQGSSPL